MTIEATGEVSILVDVIDVYFAEGEKTLTSRDMTELTRVGTLSEVLADMPNNVSGDLPQKQEDTVTIALKMQESADNKYQNKAIGSSFALVLHATQDTVESDSFDNQYDKGATLPGEVSTVEELVNAVKAGESVKLLDTLVVKSGTNLTFADDAKIELAGNDLVISQGASLKTTSGELNIVNNSEEAAKIKLTGGTIKAEGANAVINIENIEITMGTNITTDRIQVIGGATVNMNGGKFISTKRPCVSIEGGTFNMYGGEIVVPSSCTSGGIAFKNGTNAINLYGGKITVASGGTGINTFSNASIGSIYISDDFVFQLEDSAATSIVILNTNAPIITGKEPANVVRK